jgi:2-polyprenyl-6-methoxyphenol hydroxylase-like FAD-dependent oxidoreductase
LSESTVPVAPTRTEVLIVGAGPTGLVLALWLKRLGVQFRLIDQVAGPGTTSRALAVQARTLEFYSQLGIAEEVIERGLEVSDIGVWVRGRRKASVSLMDIGQGLSPFPRPLIFPQEQHEQLLIEHLRRAGVEVERKTQLLGFEEVGDRIIAELQNSDGATVRSEAAFIAGCDGAHSRVREVLGFGFPGGTYDHLFYVADVELQNASAGHGLQIGLAESDFLIVFPMKQDNVVRLVGTVQRGSELRDQALTWEDVSHGALRELKLQVERVRWFSSYRVHHRVAAHFGRGRAFLLGDAAHIHSPVGGQGMNTGIGDAINLAWKLAAVLQRRAGPHLLDSYEPERIAFARRLVATTDRGFTAVTSDSFWARFLRLRAVPRLAPLFLRLRAVRRLMFRTVSQILVNYRGGQLSEGEAGSVRGGDRLPWVKPEDGTSSDNFAPLSSLGWQLHVYGDASSELAEACASRGLPLHVFPWRPAASSAGLSRNAAYLIRPDGYVGLADASASVSSLTLYINTHGLRFRP